MNYLLNDRCPCSFIMKAASVFPQTYQIDMLSAEERGFVFLEFKKHRGVSADKLTRSFVREGIVS